MPLWSRILVDCTEAEAFCLRGDLRGRFRALCRAQNRIATFDLVMRQVVDSDAAFRPLFDLHTVLLSLLEAGNIEGTARPIRLAQGLAEAIGHMWALERFEVAKQA